ncbi:MAG TPA: hypothetical protein VFE31_16010 [Opitutaceae bacterium]|nr:hypothetical protein [Opitutaceae bacterium]
MNAARPAAAALALAAARLAASDPPPSQPPNAVNPPYSGGALNNPFPDNVYGADHGGSTLVLTYPFLSPFGRTDHSRGVIVYACAPFTPRRSEGVYGMDVWLEQQNASGTWSPAALNGGLPDGAGSPYQPVNTPNPGPSPAYSFHWTFDATPLPKFAAFRVFIYVYLYNQGGGSQGNFYVASSLGEVLTGAAADAPVIAWDPSAGAVNPPQPAAGSDYEISATAESDNGDLATVTLWQDGGPFASAGPGSGWSSNAAGSAAAAAGTTVTYTAEAADAQGLQSGPISLTVTVPGKLAQAPISASNVTLTLGDPFTPPYAGGSGTGAWQFCVGDHTNFDGGVSQNAGTDNPDGGWSPSWTPPAVGNYSFWIARDGDAAYLPAGPVGFYTLTVVAPPAPPSRSPSSTSPEAGSSTSSGSASAPPPAESTSGSATPPASPPASGSSSSQAPSSSGSSSGSSDTSGAPASGSASSGTGGTTGGGTSVNAGSSPAASPPATPSSSSSGSAGSPSSPSTIVRLRFNALGEETTIHTDDTHSDAPIWTDPSSLAISPWPSFAAPAPATINLTNIPLPAIPPLP